MNFEHMPELQVWWAYPIIWSTMLAVAAEMLAFFWKKGWIGSHGASSEAHRQKRENPESREPSAWAKYRHWPSR